MASRNVARLTRKLEMIGKRATDAVKAEILQGADRIVSGQKRRAPKDKGILAASIHHSGLQESKDNVSVTISAGGDATSKSVEGWGGEQVDYAVEQEFGNQHMDAHPFFYPEVRAQDRKIRRSVRRAFSASAKE